MPSLLYSNVPEAAHPSFWIILFWICVSTAVYTYAGYPLLLWLVTRFKKDKPLEPSETPSLTLLIAAHNEETGIGEKLKQSLSLNYPKDRLQILVVSDGSTDDTVSVVRTYARFGVELLVLAGQRGKTAAQNVAILQANGDIIVFSDATTNYDVDALRYLAGAFADERVGAVSGRYAYVEEEHATERGQGAKAYAGYDNRLRHMQSSAGSITGCCGCIYAVRRSLYVPLDPHIISDLVEPLHVLLQDKTVKFEPRAFAQEMVGHGSKKEFSMRVRVVTRALNGLNSVREILVPWKYPWIAFQLLSHKLLRYAIPLLLLGVFASSLMLHQLPFYRMALTLQLLMYGMALLGALAPVLRRFKPVSLALYFCVVNAAAFCGVIQFLRGKNYVIWRPQRGTSHAA